MSISSRSERLWCSALTATLIIAGLPMASVFVGHAAPGDTTQTIEVVKRLVPTSDPGRFDLQIDGITDPDGHDVGDGGSTGVEQVTVGSHTVGELGHGETSLDRYLTIIECIDRVTGAIVDDTNGEGLTLDIPVGPGDAILCTITDISGAHDAAPGDRPAPGYGDNPGDPDFLFDTPFDNAGDTANPVPTADVGVTATAPPTPSPGDLPAISGATAAQPAPAVSAPASLDELPRTT